jgi:formylglycine-generating enzyme required for sulfatase activity
MTNDPDIQQKIAELEATLKLSLPDSAREAIERELAALKGQATSVEQEVSGDSAVGVAGDAQDSPITTGDENTVGQVRIEGDSHGQTIGVNLGIAIMGRPLEDDEKRRLGWYLNNLANNLVQLRLQGIASRLSHEGEGVALPNVYVMLATESLKQTVLTTPDEIERYFEDGKAQEVREAYDPDQVLPDQAIVRVEPRAQHQTSEESSPSDVVISRAVLVHDAIAHHPRLVLRGEPGSGKSTVLFYLAWLLARRGLGDKLTEEQTQMLKGWKEHLLPVILPLRTLAGNLGNVRLNDANDLADPPSATPLVTQTLHTAMQHNDTRRIDDLLDGALQRGSAIIFCDGLDEVPVEGKAGERASRRTTLQAVKAFATTYPAVPVVVTCRTRAFSEHLERMLGPSWHIETLAPLTLGQVRHFVPHWYGELVQKHYLRQEQASQYAEDLLVAITDPSRERLRDMASTPLLLTLMAWVLCENTILPRDRADLYEAILNLLLEEWDKLQRHQRLEHAIGLPGWDGKRLLPVLDRLSYEAHVNADSKDGRGRLDKTKLERALRSQFEQAGSNEADAARAAVLCVAYFEQRSGLIAPDGEQNYVFAHLTLQEYCAGRHMLRRRDAHMLVMQHRQEDRWHEPIKLGVGVIQKTNGERVDRVLRCLVAREENGELKPTPDWYRDLILAGEIGEERNWQQMKEDFVEIEPIQRDLRAGLATLLNDPAHPIPTVERVRAGFLLGDLGDPRPGVCSLPPAMVRIEGGEFMMGDEDKAHPVSISTFEIARYPLTNAQYKLFIDDNGYNPSRPWWDEAGRAWLQNKKVQEPREWNHERFGIARPNHPVSIYWYEAVAFCRWLTQRLQDGYTYRLPTEAEWEYAARRDTLRIYPWGNAEPDGERANYGGTYNGTTAVGCFPLGATPNGLQDMAGNVWEWTGSIYKPYPYDPTDGREDTRQPLGNRFVFRGCGWLYQLNTLRASFRSHNLPDYQDYDLGFRPARCLSQNNRVVCKKVCFFCA